MNLLLASSTMMLAFISHPSIHWRRVWMLREMSSRDVQVKSSGVEPQVTQGGSAAEDQQDEVGIRLINEDTNERK